MQAMNELVQATFDYSLIGEDQASQLQAIYNRVLTRHMATNYEDGKDLTEAENIQGLPYAMFIAWAHGVFGWSERTIDNKKNAYLRWGDFTATVAVIEDRAMYLLSTKRVPESAREEAKERLNTGEDITEEAAKQIRDAHKAKEQAEATEKRTRLELNQQIAGLQQEIERLSTPTIIQVMPPEVEIELVELKGKVKKLTEQRDNLSRKAEELGKEAREATLKRNEEERERQVRQNWQKLTKDFQLAVVKLMSQLPSPIDVQVFEAEDWERLSQAKELARRFIAECESLSRSPSMIIDSSWQVPYAVES
jgi:hypothetical protein